DGWAVAAEPRSGPWRGDVPCGRAIGARTDPGGARACLHRSRGRRGRLVLLDHSPSRLAEYRPHCRRAIRDHGIVRHYYVGKPQLSRSRDSAADAGLGEHGALGLRCACNQPGAESCARIGDRRACPWLLSVGKFGPMTRPPPEPLLDVRRLSVTFMTRERDIAAVKDVSFALHQGETLAIVGESGCGKSTTGLALMGLIDRGRGTNVTGSIDLVR